MVKSMTLLWLAIFWSNPLCITQQYNNANKMYIKIEF